jgi:hypothetical protein
MLKYIGNFLHAILPSVIATVVGAYIVNHYVNKPDPPPQAAAAVTADPRAPSAVSPDTAAIDPAAKTKSADKPTAAASAPDKRWHQPAPREKLAKAPAAATTAPAPATTGSVTPVSAPERAAAEERRDANDLARAAIERLRATAEPPRPAEAAPRIEAAPRVEAAHGETASRPDSARGAESSRLAAAPPLQPVQALPAIAPLPPAVTIAPASTPGEAYSASASITSASARPPADLLRPTPPADIPRPLDLQADAAPPRSSVTEDVLSAARSVIHAVLPR